MICTRCKGVGVALGGIKVAIECPVCLPGPAVQARMSAQADGLLKICLAKQKAYALAVRNIRSAAVAAQTLPNGFVVHQFGGPERGRELRERWLTLSMRRRFDRLFHGKRRAA